MRDVTRRKLAEEALRESEKKYSALFETTGQGHVVAEMIRDADGRATDYRLIDLNPAFERLVGIAVADARGRTAREVFVGLEDFWIETCDRVVRRGVPERVEHEVASLDRWYEVYIYPAGGDRYTALYKDITERKREERRQAFFLKLSDALQPLTDTAEITKVASKLTGKYLGVIRVGYYDIFGETFTSGPEYVDGVAPLGGEKIMQFGEVWLQEFRDNEMMVSENIEDDERFSEAERAFIRSQDIGAFAVAMLVKGGRWVGAFAVHNKAPRRWWQDEIELIREVGGRVREAGQRGQAEQALRESEEQHAFLLKLSDALRSFRDPEAIQEAASRLLGEHLEVDRAAYGALESGDEFMTVARDWTSPGTSSVVGKYRIDDFGRFFSDPLREGRASVIEDASTDPRVSRPMYESSWRSIGVRSAIAYPLVKGGQFVAAIFVHGRDARTWSASEVSLVSEVGEHTWGAIERHRAEAALGESEDKYRTLFESIDEGFCIVEVLFGGSGEPVDYRFLESNPAFERHTGLHDAAGKRMRELEPRHEEHWFETYGRIALTGEPERFQNAAEYLGGRYFDVYAFRIGAPEERKVAIIFTNITRRKEEEEERLRLRALEASAQSEASERQRIGHELHDWVAHTMGVAHQSLQLHRAYAASDPERAAEKLELAADATKTALNQTRDLSAQLARRGVKETSDGLGSALSELLASYVPDGVETKLSVEGDESAVSTSVGDEVYLIMREAVRNAVEHSGGGRVEVKIEVGDGELRGCVEDDREGFDPHGVSEEEAPKPAGVGLGSMRERTELLGGRLELDSEPGSGTVVEVRIPLAG